jgi:5'-deoxynucleotidase YfbR-like HD superfamily hydrolase
VSVWNRIGDIASNTAKGVFNFPGEVVERGASFTKDLLGSAGGVAKFAWDVGTAPWNDDDEYNGFVQPFKTAAAKQGGDIVKPLASAGGAIMKVPGVAPALETLYKVNQEAIREPLTTYYLMQGEVMGGNVLGYFDPDTWKKAYKGAQEISLGQAYVGQFRAAYDPKFNIYDPREREAAFKKSAWGRAASGGVDLVAQFFADLSIVGGKAAKLAKASELGVGKLTNANAVAKAAEEITKAQYGVNNRFSKVLKDFTDNNSTYALSHPMVKSSSNPGLLAHLLGDSVDLDETALILRSSLGDPKALDDLRLQRAYISDALEAERGKLSAVDEFKLFAAPDGSGMLPFLNDNKAVTDEALANYRSLAANDKYFADLMEVGKAGGTLTRTTGKILQGVEDFVAKSRSAKFYDQAVGTPKVEIFQPTPFHKMYQKISWLGGERPAGLVDFNDPDSYREVIANVSRLEKRLNLTPDESKALLDPYLAASTPELKFQATLALEGTALRSLAAKYNVSEEIANDIYNNYSRARTSALKSIQDKGFMVDTDGSILRIPQLESQTANFLPIMDFDMMDDLLKRNARQINLLSNTKNAVFNSLDFVQDMFKAAVLLRLGYTIRNTVDSSLRIAASIGAYAQLRHLGPGLKNILNDTVSTPARLVDKYRAVDSGMTFKQVQQANTKVIDDLNVLKTKIAALEANVSLKPDDLDLAGELNTLKLLQDEKRAVYNHYSQVLNKSKNAKPDQRIGSGSFEVTTSDGQAYILDDAFGGPLGDMFKRIASSGNSFERMVDSNTDLYKNKLMSKGIGAVKPTDPGYFDQWAQTLRTQFGNSSVVKKIIKGESADDIARWLKASPEGRDLRRRLAINSEDSIEYVNKVNGFLDQYLPVSSNLRNKISDITANDLRATFKDPTTLPIIHGHVLADNLFDPSNLKPKNIINSLFKLLATMPEDAFARNPVYVHLYRQEAKRRLEVMSGLKNEIVSVADQEAIMMQAHKSALREMKGILFNIERKTNLATAMKYINPFFSAQENAYKTWTKLAIADPSIINKGYLVWQSPNRLGLVTDEEGNQVPVGQTSGNDTIWLDLPKGVTKIPGLESLTTLGIPKGSLDIIFQGGLDILYNTGNPNLFSDIFPVGPYVGVTVGELTKNQPGVRESLKGMFPYGLPKDAISAFLPPWLQRELTRKDQLNDPQFARTYQLIWKTEQQNAKRDGKPPVSPAKIMDMTKDYWRMRTYANLIMPFSPRFETPYKYYLDKSREYKRIYGVDADAKFLNDYPEYFDFSASLSKNPTSVQSSVQAAGNIKKYDTLISQLSKIDPKLIGLVVNDPAGYDFSQASYNFLYNRKISPDSPDTFLSSQSPAESQKKNDAEKGWIQYNVMSDDIDEALRKRGLSSVQETGAEDLKYIKEQVIRKLAIQTDADGTPLFDKNTGQYVQTAWYDDYLDSDGSKTNKVIVGLGAILNDPEFVKNNRNNTTWKSVSTYLSLRKDISSQLIDRDVKSIDAKANKDLRYVYDAVVNKLKSDDKLGFSYLYDRFLSQDLVFDKYLTPKETK